MTRPPMLLCPVRDGTQVQPNRGSGWRRGSSSADSHSPGRRCTRFSTSSLAPSARTTAMKMRSAPAGVLAANRPVRRPATSASHVPRIAIANLPDVWSTTYQWRGRKKDGTKLPVEKVLIRDKCARARFQRMRPRSLLLLVPRKILGAGKNLVTFPRFLALRARLVPRGVTHKLKKTWVVAVLVLL